MNTSWLTRFTDDEDFVLEKIRGYSINANNFLTVLTKGIKGNAICIVKVVSLFPIMVKLITGIEKDEK